ncbi:hypothetical protein [Gordonia crocea]|uniref:Uncharacterized protein n=1 Tax=Gordonia crocea TaxID=589162 RepID=A0A7I9UWX4_9ACTN|nr:hypothetical protein [Gordonia crocea]GED97687.1 hypothetical protein nbrc107697_17260 [Gordonia crocea]
MSFRRPGPRIVVGAVSILSALSVVAPATAAPRPVPDGKCVISQTNRDRTIDSLMNHCTGPQILKLFGDAPLGKAPTGRQPLALLPVMHTRGKLAPYEQARAFTRTQSRFGSSLTFTKGPQGQPWVYKDYTFGRDLGAPVKLGRSNWDGKPAWTADFRADFLGVPISIHEYRQLTPQVWIARDTGGVEKNPKAAKHSGGAMALG